MAAVAPDFTGRPPDSLRAILGRLIDRYLLIGYTLLAVIYLLLPVAVVILFSFNNPPGRSNFVWSGFTLKYWLNPFGVAGLLDAVGLSLIDRVPVHADRDRARHADRHRPGALPVPRACRGQLADLPADGDAGDHHGRIAADPVRVHRIASRSSR